MALITVNFKHTKRSFAQVCRDKSRTSHVGNPMLLWMFLRNLEEIRLCSVINTTFGIE